MRIGGMEGRRSADGTASARVLRIVTVALWVATAGCQREERRFREVPPSATPGSLVNVSGGFVPGPREPEVVASTPYLNNAWAVSEGESLYNQMNCVGCHFHGGGGIGPPLMDREWIYGSQPENIYQTIEEGRPNGMPAWGAKLSSDQIWKITAYVMSMSGQLKKDIAPGRQDHMQGKKQEQGTEVKPPVPYGGQPPSTVFP